MKLTVRRPLKRSRAIAYEPGIAANSVNRTVISETIRLLRRNSRKPWPPASGDFSTRAYAEKLISDSCGSSDPGCSNTSSIGRRLSTNM